MFDASILKRIYFLLDIHYGDVYLSFKVHQKIIKFWQKLIKLICNKLNQVNVYFRASLLYPSKLLINVKYFFICWRHLVGVIRVFLLLLRNAEQTNIVALSYFSYIQKVRFQIFFMHLFVEIQSIFYFW